MKRFEPCTAMWQLLKWCPMALGKEGGKFSVEDNEAKGGAGPAPAEFSQ